MAPPMMPVPSTATPFARARSSMRLPRAELLSSGKESSSHVETTWNPASTACSIWGVTDSSREPVHRTTTSARVRSFAEEVSVG